MVAKKPRTPGETPVWNFRFTLTLRRRMEELAAGRGMTMTAAMHEAATDWIRKQERIDRASER